MPDDITKLMEANSDQLNADDLVGGPITAQIEGYKITHGEQPLAVFMVSRKPWKPCKTMMKVLSAAWGADPAPWAGRWIRLFRDPGVMYGGVMVGGIRISGMSDILRPLELTLNKTKKTKAVHRIEVITPEMIRQFATSTPDIEIDRAVVLAFLESIGAGPPQLIAFIAKEGGREMPPMAEWKPEQLAWAAKGLTGKIGAEFKTWMNTTAPTAGDEMPE